MANFVEVNFLSLYITFLVIVFIQECDTYRVYIGSQTDLEKDEF